MPNLDDHGLEVLKKAGRTKPGSNPKSDYEIQVALTNHQISELTPIPVTIAGATSSSVAQVPNCNQEVVDINTSTDHTLPGEVGFILEIKRVTSRSSEPFFCEIFKASDTVETLIGEPRTKDEAQFDNLTIAEGETLTVTRYNLGSNNDRIYTAIHYSKRAV